MKWNETCQEVLSCGVLSNDSLFNYHLLSEPHYTYRSEPSIVPLIFELKQKEN